MKPQSLNSKLRSSKTFQVFTSIILFMGALLMITQGFQQTGMPEKIGNITFGIGLILTACNTGSAFEKRTSDAPEKTKLKP